MNVTLNDEQWKALQRWWREVGSNPNIHEYGGSGPPNNGASLELREAIAPMMKPWRVGDDYEGKSVVLGIVLGSVWCYDGEGPSARSSPDLARRVCDLLNESEARQ